MRMLNTWVGLGGVGYILRAAGGQQVAAGSLLLVLASCAPAVRTTQTGTPRAPLAPNCELTLVSPSDVYPDGKYGADYEPVGLISVSAKVGTEPTDPAVKEAVRPEACKLGAELIAVVASSAARNDVGMKLRQGLGFVAYARKVSAAPQKF